MAIDTVLDKEPATETPPEKIGSGLLPPLPSVTDSDDSFVGAEESEAVKDDGLDKLRGTLSSKGDKYDPSIHAYPPKETQGGKWSKKRGRGGQKAGEPQASETNAAFRNEAQQTAQLYALMNHVALGEGAEVKEDELGPMIEAWQRYYQVNGISEQSPLTGVLITSGLYSYAVATRESVWPRVKGAFVWMGKFVGLIKEDESDALNDSRQQQQRENQSSKSAGEGSGQV